VSEEKTVLFTNSIDITERFSGVKVKEVGDLGDEGYIVIFYWNKALTKMKWAWGFHKGQPARLWDELHDFYKNSKVRSGDNK